LVDFWLPTNKHETNLNAKAKIALTGYKQLLQKDQTVALSYSSYRIKLPAPVCSKLDVDCSNKDLIDKYRTFSGVCNNLEDNKRWWGSIDTPYKRLLPHAYDDKVSEPRIRSYVPKKFLPNARKVAIEVHEPKRTVSEWSAFSTYFGQFMIHDLVLTPKSSYNDGKRKYCPCDSYDPECFNIPIP
jgi:hypothetical protein